MMDLPSPPPSRRLLAWASAARWALRVVVGLWLALLLVWAGLHWLIVPRIDVWGGTLERWASRALGQTVQIGRLQGQSNGLFPTLELQDVRLLDAQQRPALTLPRVVLTVSPRSVLRGGLEQLYIDAPEVQLRRLADGRWQVAGQVLEVAPERASPQGHPALAWLLAQPELVLRAGRLHWLDEAQSYEQHWQQVDVVLRAQGRRHALRLDARDAQGQSVHLAGVLRAPLSLSGSEPPWQRWRGQWFAQMHWAQLPPLPWPQTGPLAQVAELQAAGQVRVWLDVEQGRIVGGSSDWALRSARLDWRDAQQPPLVLADVQGRLSLHRTTSQAAPTWELEAQRLGFDWLPDPDSPPRHWPASHWRVAQTGPDQWQGQLHAEAAEVAEVVDVADAVNLANAPAPGLDLGLAQALLTSLPLPPHWQRPLQRLQPQGQLRQLRGQWDGRQADQPRYQAQGLLAGLGLPSQPAPTEPAEDGATTSLPPGQPGVQGLDVAFALTEQGGQASLGMEHGVLSFPGVFEEPDIPVQQLAAQVRWQRQGDGGWALDIEQARFANADAQGQLQAHWQTGPDADSRLPGILTLHGTLSRAEGTRVHRYLPLHIPAPVRHYVRDSVLAGQGQQVQFEVRGDLRHMPFADPGTGRFYIAAPLQAVDYDYVPAQLRTPQQAPWPVLRQLSGTLEFEGASLRMRDVATSLIPAQGPPLRMAGIQAEIADLLHPQVQVQAQGRGPLDSMLGLLRGSAIEQLTQGALTQAQAQGQATLALRLDLPLMQIQDSRVQGALQLAGNQVRFSPDSPLLEAAQGRITFHEQGFALEDVQAQALGGPVRLSGGMADLRSGLHVQAQGRATAAGLRQHAPLALVRQLARHASGASAYTLDITAPEGAPRLLLRTDLHGLALALPAPLDKPADQPLPLLVDYHPGHLSHSGQPAASALLNVLLEGRGHLRYVLDARTGQARSGFISLGAFDSPLPTPGGQEVVASVRLPLLDVDAWGQVLGMGTPGADTSIAGAADTDTVATAQPFQSYLPQRLSLQVQELRLLQRPLHQVQAQLSQQAGRWRGQVLAQELDGYIDYRPAAQHPPSGLAFVRLEHLRIPPAEPQPAAAGAAPPPAQPPPAAQTADAAPHSAWPALDIHVKDLQVAQARLGQLFVLARPRPQDGQPRWALERFQLHAPEARWKAQGWWAAASPQQPERTELAFTLEAQDAGQLLARLGMPGVLQQGQGQLDGQVQWQGSPLQPYWPSMQGQVRLDMGQGQFLKAEPGMGKLLSVLSLQSISRRLSGDFRDIFSAGFAFDFVRGDIAIAQGVARTHNLQMQGLNAAVLMRGQAHLQEETQQLRLVVVPEINAMSASLLAAAINPVVGLGSLLAQALLRKPVMAAATRAFDVSGSWAEPVVTPAKHHGNDNDNASAPE